MNVIYENLYTDLFERNKSTINSITILVGYASADILEKLVADFPNVKINLIIGMAREGIYIDEHKRYQELTMNNSDVNVFYHIKNPKNHIKLYVFNNAYTYVGSANFSTIAFSEHQEEILIRVEDNLIDLIRKAYDKSCICTDEKNVSAFIFYDKENLPPTNSVQNEMEIKKETTDNFIPKQDNNDIEKREKYFNLHSVNKKHRHRKSELNRYITLKNPINAKFRSEIEVTPILPAENDNRWDIDGINTPPADGRPHLIATNANDFRNFFHNKEFTLYVKNQKNYETFQAFLGGNFRKKLMFEEKFNIYHYIKSFTNIIEERPLSYNDLMDNNIKHLKFTRLNEVEYILEVIKK